MDLDQRVDNVSWYTKEHRKDVKDFYILLSRKFSEEDKDLVSQQLNELTSKLAIIKLLLGKANAELDIYTKRAYQNPDVPQPRHGNGKERDAIIEDLCVAHRYLRDVFEGLDKAAVEKINYGKILLKKGTEWQ